MTTADSFFRHAAAQAQTHLERLPLLKRTPPVSVIIPTHNRPELLKEALHSLEEQSYPHWEAIVVNDGGKALSAGAGGLPDDPRIRIVNLNDHRERSACRNLALDAVKGEYICFLDDDDIFYPWHLEVLLRSLEYDPERRRIAYSDSHRVWGDYRNGRFREHRIEPAFGQPFDADELLVANSIPILALLFHRDALQNERFDENLNLFEDHDLLIRLSRRFDFLHVPVVTHRIRAVERDDTFLLQRRTATFRMLYKRYSLLTEDRWDVQWRQKVFLRSLENLHHRKAASYLPSVTIILPPFNDEENEAEILQAFVQNTDYEFCDFLLVTAKRESRLCETLGPLYLRCRVLHIAPDVHPAEAANEAVRHTSSDLLFFPGNDVLPVKSGWLAELVEVYQKGADPVSGSLVDASNGISTAPIGVALNEKDRRPVGLYGGYPFYLPPVNRIRPVEAVLAGAVLISRRLFLQTGGLDAGLGENARWINLCLEGKRHHRAAPAFDPFAAFLVREPPPYAHPVCPPADAEILKERWGDGFLRPADEIYAEDGFFRRKTSAGARGKSGDGIFERLIRWADRLLEQGRQEEARAVLEPLGRLLLGNEGIREDVADRRASLDQHEFAST